MVVGGLYILYSPLLIVHASKKMVSDLDSIRLPVRGLISRQPLRRTEATNVASLVIVFIALASF